MEPIRPGLFEISQDGSGYLLTNKCERCKISYFPRREKCIKCFNNDQLKNTTLSGSGKLYTYTTVYRATPDFKVPFMVGYVDFEQEGIRVLAQITACRPEDLEIEMEMELVYEEMDMVEKEKS